MNTLWQPRPGCDPSCLPRPGSTPTVHIGVRLMRLAALAGVMVAGAAMAAVLPLLAPARRAACTRAWAGAALRAVGVRLSVRGRLPGRRALIAANHISWLDILAVLAQTPARLVAKREVRGWPVIGALAAAAGTIFIDRSRPRTLPETVRETADAMRAGAVVAVFPEGTTWCGVSSGRYRPALFQAALAAGAAVAPVTLRFRLADGSGTTAAAFLGDDTLWASLCRVIAIDGLTIAMVASPVVHPGGAATRRALARLAEGGSIAMYRVS